MEKVAVACTIIAEACIVGLLIWTAVDGCASSSWWDIGYLAGLSAAVAGSGVLAIALLGSME